MDRRKAVKAMAGTLAVGGAGYFGLKNLFKHESPMVSPPKKIEFVSTETEWKYIPLDPEITSQIAYDSYKKGGCMYGIFASVVSQLAEKVGEPWSTFPIQMMKYGHGGIGGAGTICGSLNGASALFGLLVVDKEARDALTMSLFGWYEETAFPSFQPSNPVFDYTPPTAISHSVLCHSSGTSWCKENGFAIGSDERIERCRRLTADVAAQSVKVLNDYFNNTFVTTPLNQNVNDCLSCHGSTGKLANTLTKMNCTPCHQESLGHKVLGDIHYHLMDTVGK